MLEVAENNYELAIHKVLSGAVIEGSKVDGNIQIIHSGVATLGLTRARAMVITAKALVNLSVTSVICNILLALVKRAESPGNHERLTTLLIIHQSHNTTSLSSDNTMSSTRQHYIIHQSTPCCPSHHPQVLA